MKKLLSILLCSALIFSLSACGKDKEKEKEVTLEPKQPEIVEFPAEVGGTTIESKPSAIVSLSPALTEIIFDLDYDKDLFGVSEFCNYPEDALDIQKVGNSKVIDFDSIKKISPDIVFTSSKISDMDTLKLEEMGAKVVYLPLAEDTKELWTLYDNIGIAMEGQTTGAENAKKAYKTKQDYLQDIANAINDYIDNGGATVTTAYVGKPKFNVATGDTFVGQALKYIGLVNIADNYENWTFPEAEATSFTPDLLIYQEGFPKEKLRELYSSTPALTNGFLYTLDTTMFQHQGFRMIDELIGIAKYAYSNADFPQQQSETTTTKEVVVSEESSQ